MVELFGMIADRQQAEKKGGGGVPKKKAVLRIAGVPQQMEAISKRLPDADKVAEAKAPVPIEKAGDNQSKKEDNAAHQEEDQAESNSGSQLNSTVYIPAATNSGSGGGENGNNGPPQQQLTIGYENRERDATREYLSRLSKRLQTHLEYPEEVRKHGIEGVSWIQFTITESGDIRKDSLRIKQSSGYASLDANALKAVRISSPYERPPKELKVAIAVEFAVEAIRGKQSSIR